LSVSRQYSADDRIINKCEAVNGMSIGRETVVLAGNLLHYVKGKRRSKESVVTSIHGLLYADIRPI
jgi:hypothetical protein